MISIVSLKKNSVLVAIGYEFAVSMDEYLICDFCTFLWWQRRSRNKVRNMTCNRRLCQCHTVAIRKNCTKSCTFNFLFFFINHSIIAPFFNCVRKFTGLYWNWEFISVWLSQKTYRKDFYWNDEKCKIRNEIFSKITWCGMI